MKRACEAIWAMGIMVILAQLGMWLGRAQTNVPEDVYLAAFYFAMLCVVVGGLGVIFGGAR